MDNIIHDCLYKTIFSTTGWNKFNQSDTESQDGGFEVSLYEVVKTCSLSLGKVGKMRNWKLKFEKLETILILIKFPEYDRRVEPRAIYYLASWHLG